MSRKILYIDDEADLVELAFSFFEDEGLPIDHCSSVQEALILVRQNTYDVIISDMQLPDGSGYELFKAITDGQQFSGKFILVTGNLNISKDINQTQVQVMYKPLDFFKMVEIVRAHLK